MLTSESVVLSLPRKVCEIQDAADQFVQQYQCIPMIEIRGHVQLENGQQCFIQDWHTVGSLDHELDIIGLGMPGDPIDALSWVAPTGPGEFRLSEMEEENQVYCCIQQSPYSPS